MIKSRSHMAILSALISVTLSACFLPTRIHEYEMTNKIEYADKEIWIHCGFLDNGSITLVKGSNDKFLVHAIWLKHIPQRSTYEHFDKIVVSNVAVQVEPEGDFLPLFIDDVHTGQADIYLLSTGMLQPLQAVAEAVTVSFEITATNTETQERINKHFCVKLFKLDKIEWKWHFPMN